MRAGVIVLGWITAACTSLAGVGMSFTVVRDRTPTVVAPSAFASLPGPRDRGSPRAQPESGPDSSWTAAPFRANRQLAARPYDPRVADSISAAARAAEQEARIGAERPGWRLTGVVLGPEPVAVFDGVSGPGGATRVVGVGDELEGYAITSIGAAGVVVARAGHDWSFTVSAPWSPTPGDTR